MAWDDELIGPDVATAGLEISKRIAADAATLSIDLEDALEASRYASHPYSSYPREWPALVEVAETQELPSALIERFNASGGEGTALCGIFSEISRAWASVDNSLFIWRFDKWDGQCQEYNIEEHAILAVGLAKTKPGIFVEAIQYILILATPVELILVGVCCTPNNDGTDPYSELSLQHLPEYTVPTDGVIMSCITCTDKGNIFLAGRDGHIYELQYTSGSGWRKHSRKVCLTHGLGGFLSRWVLPNAFKFGAVDPVVDMVTDDDRHIIYARTDSMKLQVYDLGVNGDGPFRKVAEEKNWIDPRDAHHASRRSAAPRSIRASKPSVVNIAPLSCMESKSLHAVAILSDGKRLYLSTSAVGGNSSAVGTSNYIQRPTYLKVVSTRPSPPLAASGARVLSIGTGAEGGRTQPEDMALKVSTAFYSAGTLILSEDSASMAMPTLLQVQRDSTIQPSLSSTYVAAARSSRSLREIVSSLPVEGRMLCASDVLPTPDTAFIIQSLYSDAFPSAPLRESCGRACVKLRAKGDLPTQHFLPRRRIIVFNSMGLMEVVFNRPVDVLRRLFEHNAPRTQLNDFFSRFGTEEAAAMCLMLAAKLLYGEESSISNIVADKAADAFEDQGLVGSPQMDGNIGLSNTHTHSSGFNLGGVVVQEAASFSGGYRGLCLCASRLLFPVWEFPVVVVKGQGQSNVNVEGMIIFKLSSGAMKLIESKARSLELFLRSRRNNRRGLYGYVAGLGNYSGSILYNAGPLVGSNNRNELTPYSVQRDSHAVDRAVRQRPLYSASELAAMEVRAMECLRRMLRRTSEALYLLQLISQHNISRLVQNLDGSCHQQLVRLTFNQLVCTEEGDQLAMRLISALMEYYIGTDGRGTVDEISAKLKEGCPSYFNECDYRYYLAVECLERASFSTDADERESLARDAFNLLNKIPDSADLSSICRRFERLRFYEAVVRLSLQKAQAIEHSIVTTNGKMDSQRHDMMISCREECYEIVMSALRSLKGVGKSGAQEKAPSPGNDLDNNSRNKYIIQIIQLSVQWPDTAYHEHLYRTLIELSLEDELLEYGGSDLVSFLQSAGRNHFQEVWAASALSSTAQLHDMAISIPSSQLKYLVLLARYYVLKGRHLLAAHVFYRLSEVQCSATENALTLEQRYEYLSNAVLQAKSASSHGSAKSSVDDGFLDMLEAKLIVLRFQIQTRDCLEFMSSEVGSVPNEGASLILGNTENGKGVKEKVKDLSLNLKSITELYNEYAVPFQLWEVCLEMLNFANYSGEADSKVVRETWCRLLDQALSRGGIAEACSVVKRVGSNLYPGERASLPLDIICLQLEKAALERVTARVELVGDEDVARALLATCKGASEPVAAVYDQLLSNRAILPSLNLKLRMLRSILAVLREWSTSEFSNKLGTATMSGSFIFNGVMSSSTNQGMRDKIISLANRYMAEVRRLALPQSETEIVYQGFRELFHELEEKLLSPSIQRF